MPALAYGVGSRAESAYKAVKKRVLKWPGMRERPEDSTAFGQSTDRPSLRMNGARFVSFHKEDRVLYAAFHLPPSLAEEVEGAELRRGGRALGWVDLSKKEGFDEAMALAARLYEVRTGKRPPD